MGSQNPAVPTTDLASNKPSQSNKLDSQAVRRIVEHLGGWLTNFAGIGALVAIFVPLLVMIVRNGTGNFPVGSVKQFVALADALPGAVQLPPDAAYLYNTMNGPFIAQTFGISSVDGWYSLHAAMAVVCVVVIGLMATRAAGLASVGVMYAAFAAAGVSTAMIGWIGSYGRVRDHGPYDHGVVETLPASAVWWLYCRYDKCRDGYRRVCRPGCHWLG